MYNGKDGRDSSQCLFQGNTILGNHIIELLMPPIDIQVIPCYMGQYINGGTW
jgi:hypothetical protein